MSGSPTTFARGENPLRADKLNTAYSERVLRTGDAMAGPLMLSRDPVSALEAATKQYIDTVAAAFGQRRYVDVITPTYASLPIDDFLAVNSIVPVTITLASGAALGRHVTVNDTGGHAATANITVRPPSGTISGFATVLMTQTGMSLGFTFTSLGWVIG